MKKTILAGLMALTLVSGCKKSLDDFNVKQGKSVNTKEVAKVTANGAGNSISHWFTSPYWTPLICDGVVIDNLYGNLNTHCVMHYNNGSIVQMIMIFSGSITSGNTGEIFQIKETDMYDLPQGGIITFHSTIKGNMGTRIVTSAFINSQTWDMTVNRTICQPN